MLRAISSSDPLRSAGARATGSRSCPTRSRSRVGDRGANLPARHDSLQPHDPQQRSDRAAGNCNPFPIDLPPDLSYAVDVEVRFEHAPDFDQERCVRANPRRQLARISLPRSRGVIGQRGDRQHPADRPHPEALEGRPVDLSVIIDESDHVRYRRSSSSIAKQANAFLNIFLAGRSSRFSRSSDLNLLRSFVVGPVRWPWSSSAWQTQLRSVSPEQPILAVVERTTPYRDPCSP